MSSETWAGLWYGHLPEDLRPVLRAVLALEGLPDLLGDIPRQLVPHWIVGQWIATAARAKDGKSLRILADAIETIDHGFMDPLRVSVIDFAEQRGQVGQSIQEILRTAPIGEILAHVRFRGVNASDVTVRKALNSLGIRRPTGRPRGKPIN